MLDFETMMYAFAEWYIDHEYGRYPGGTDEELESDARLHWDELMKEYKRIYADKQRLITQQETVP